MLPLPAVPKVALLASASSLVKSALIRVYTPWLPAIEPSMVVAATPATEYAAPNILSAGVALRPSTPLTTKLALVARPEAPKRNNPCAPVVDKVAPVLAL